ncbi:conserved hypothetical protein [Anaeromyxobacter dehalogenans 2CP-1]|uniref:Uncharacterized protein n=1 Tax=Anaeromyxobacter dehalogenans (strain ATCC BAA-258 / DSM 21875 / 2CP-1) TaxID=455488 RepID=B8J7N6_ANAD2|nr:hypothetical protein [Anaeromyxobacter dehalogenans]ACL67216.1 conserved hypothetical protein [Anaeromyxobacter dehalogenans 2CP-1]
MTLARLALAALAAALLPRLAHAEAPAATPAARLDEAALVALAVALAVSPAPALDPAAGAADPAAVELGATVRLRQVTFEERPRIRVTLAGAGPARAWWKVERTNLPAEVEPGVVYRDVVLKLTLGGPADAVQALLDDAARLAPGVRIEPAMKDPARATPPPAALAAATPLPAVAAASPGMPEDAPAPTTLAAAAAPPAAALPASPAPPGPPAPAPAAPAPAAPSAAAPAPAAALPAPALTLLAEARTSEGERVQRLLTPDGRVLERALDAHGVLVGQREAGDLSTLPIRTQRRDERGQVVQVVDAGGGRALEILRDPMGRLLSARVLPDGR